MAKVTLALNYLVLSIYDISHDLEKGDLVPLRDLSYPPSHDKIMDPLKNPVNPVNITNYWILS